MAKWLAVAAIEPQFYRNLWQVLAAAGVPLPAPLGHLCAQQWQRDTWPVLQEALAAVFAGRGRDEWCDLFAGHDVCVAPVLSLAEAPRHPHNLARRSFVEIAGVVQPAPAPRLSMTAATVHGGPQQPAIDIESALRRWR